jgi:NAD+-dependent secondary alcohol dehydrogenase Adh1
MKAIRLHAYEKQPVLDDVSEPGIGGPLDVIVEVGGAGLCRTDLHIVEGQWAEKSNVTLPYTLGHENAGWVREVGAGVTNVAPGDTVILHPTPTCGLCRACRAGDDMHCSNSTFPGINTDGGMAEYLLTSARACVLLDPATQPADVAALADAGLTAYHAVRKALPLLYPGDDVRRHRRRRAGPHRHPVPDGAHVDPHRGGRPQPGGVGARHGARRPRHGGR